MSSKNDLINKTMKYSTNIDIIPSSIHKLNPQFSLCDIDVMYMDDNRNMTSIPLNVVKDALYSLYGVPIVGEWIEEEKRFGGHGQSIEFKDGKIIEKVSTKPIGFVTKEAVDNASFIEKKLPNGHESKTWLHLEKCILWTSRYEEAQSIIDNGASQSMEVNFEDGFYREDGVFEATKMIFSALCAIGVEPCFEEAKISRHYALDEFKQEFKLMLDEYKKINESATAVHDKETNNKPNKEEKKFMDLQKFSEILSTAKIGESDVNKYRLLNVTDSKVFALDMEDYKPYGFDYAVTTEGDAENIVIDFESKVEMSLSATDKITEENFEEFSIGSEIESVKESIFANEVPAKIDECTKILKAEYEKDIDEMGASFKELTEKYDNAVKELEKYKKKEEFEKAEQHKAEVNALFEKYAGKLGKCAEFLVYKAKCNPDEVTLDEVSEKLTLMVGKYMMESGAKKNFSYNPTETGVAGRKNETIENKYGHLLDKYMK